MDDPEIQQTALFLWEITRTLSTTCPAVSRYCMSTIYRNVGNSMVNQLFTKFHQHCKYCGSLFSYLNYKIRIQPIPHPNRHIKKLLKWEREQPWKLSNRQKKKLKKYKESRNKIIYTCNVCKKATTLVGLKKYRAKEQEMLFNNPTPKIKLKKGDLHAGLFIRTPTEKKIPNEKENDIKDDKCQKDVEVSSTPELMDSSNPNNTPQTIRKMHMASEIKKNVTPQTTSSSKRKKKGLLAHILNQEQEAKRQKKTLSSFLTSL